MTERTIAKKLINEYKDNLEMLKLIKQFAEENISKFELIVNTKRLNQMLNTNCYEIIEDYYFEHPQHFMSDHCIKINNIIEWTTLTIEKTCIYDKTIGTIIDKICVKIDGIIIIDDYNHKTLRYIPNNTNEITLDKNNFASKEDLIKILDFF
jgi:hypothetical protein